MNGTVKQFVTHPYFALACFLAVCVFLPRFAGASVNMACCSGLLTMYVLMMPESFRSRTGSLGTAMCLVAALWAATAVITVLTLMGQIQG